MDYEGDEYRRSRSHSQSRGNDHDYEYRHEDEEEPMRSHRHSHRHSRRHSRRHSHWHPHGHSHSHSHPHSDGSPVAKIFDWDDKLTKELVNQLLSIPLIQKLQKHNNLLEFSGHGVGLLLALTAYILKGTKPKLYQMEIAMIEGLIMDTCVVKLLKAVVKRKRPETNPDVFAVEQKNYSFPSGFASRTSFLFGFFSFVHPSPISKFILPWAFLVAVYKILNHQNFTLDMVGGSLVGLIEVALLAFANPKLIPR